MKRKYCSVASVLIASSILAACSSASAQSSEGSLKSARTIDSVYKVKEILSVGKTKSSSIEQTAKSEPVKVETTKSSAEVAKKPETPAAPKKEEPAVADTASTQPQQSQSQTPQPQSQQPSQVLNTAIVYQGKVLHYGPNFGPLETTNGAAYQAQAFIDSSPWTNIALGWNDVNFNDGVGTYMAGHNRGVFTPLTSLDYGGTIDVYDRAGNKKTYVVRERTHLWNDTGQPSTVTYEVDQMLEKMKVTESIVIQYCLGSDMQLYYLTPID